MSGGNFGGGGGGGGAVSSVVGQTGAVTGAQIAADPGLTATFDPIGAAQNPADTGFDLVIAAGQSNMWGAGNTPNSSEDPTDSRVWQFAQSGTYSGKVIGASDPLVYPLTSGSASSGMGPALVFSRWYASAIRANRRVLIVPVAVGSTTIQTNWDPAGSGNLYTGTITTVAAALAAAGANSRVTAILWAQGETDGINNYSGANYQTKLDALIAGWRAAFGSATTPFVISGMVPEAVTGTTTAIRAVQADAPNRNAYTWYWAGPAGMQAGDNLHYTAPAQRLNGRGLFEAFRLAQTNTGAPSVPIAPTGLTATAASTQVALSWTAPNVSIGSAISDYVVQYRTTSGPGAWTTFADGTSTATTATVTGLTNSTSYDFRVAAVNATGTGAYSATATATPIAATVPGAPTGLVVSVASSGQLALTWTAPASNGGSAISDYVVQYRTPNGSGSWTTFSHTASTTAAITVTGLTNGSVYGIQVAAVNAIGTGSFTAEGTGTPSAGGLVDTFTGTNGTALTAHTSDSGHTWATNTTMAATIQSNTLSGSGNSPFVVASSSFAPASADYSVTIDMTPTGNVSQITGPMARIVSGQATGYALIPFGGTQFQLWLLNNGSNSQIGSGVAPSGGLSTSENYRMTLTVAGTTITGKIQRLSDNNYLTSGGAWQVGTATALSTTNGTLTATGKAGFGLGSTTAVIDNISTS